MSGRFCVNEGHIDLMEQDLCNRLHSSPLGPTLHQLVGDCILGGLTFAAELHRLKPEHYRRTTGILCINVSTSLRGGGVAPARVQAAAPAATANRKCSPPSREEAHDRL